MHYITPLEAFLALLRVTLGRESLQTVSFDASLWADVYAIAQKQGLVGVLYEAVKELPASARPDRKLWLQWVVSAEQIKKHNAKADQTVAKVFSRLQEDGFEALLLKGQGTARLYPVPHSRLAGDIDVWVLGARKQIIDYVRRDLPNCRPVYHHVDARIAGADAVELHFFPTWMYNYFANRRLQKMFCEYASKPFSSQCTIALGGVEVPIPTVTFNSIYVLIHLYRHLFEEGIGLRQLLDYYYIWQQRENLDVETYKEKLTSLRLTNFAAAVGYVFHQWFGVPVNELIIAPNERLGRQLMTEILISGNFGKYGFGQVLRRQTRFQRVRAKFKRNMQFLRAYPEEVIAAPLFKIWHYLWRKRHGWTR